MCTVHIKTFSDYYTKKMRNKHDDFLKSMSLKCLAFPLEKMEKYTKLSYIQIILIEAAMMLYLHKQYKQ